MDAKVLLLYGSWGWGHKKAALAIQEVLANRGIDAASMDVLQMLPAPFASIYSSSYTALVTRFRSLWKFIYETTDRNGNGYTPHKSLWQAWQYSGVLRHLRAGNFTHVISTHFLTSALLAGWRTDERWNVKIFSVVTDFTAHRYWKRAQLDHYFVPCDDVREQMIHAGIAPGDITVSGIPISPAFQIQHDCDQIRKEAGCLPGKPVVFVLTSGFGMTYISRLIAELQSVDAHFMLSAGKHAPTVEEVRRRCGRDPRFTVFGIIQNMPELMQASDLLITKPGGITSSEALAVRLPVVLLPPIPGQEEGNAHYLTRSGVAVWPVKKHGELAKTITLLLSDQTLLSSLKAKAAHLGKPRAAELVVDVVLKNDPASSR